MTTPKTVTMSVGGEDLKIDLADTLTALVHNDDMVVKGNDPNVVDVTPEETVACANAFVEGQWAWLREQPSFQPFWAGLWGSKPLPETLDTLAAKHTAGLILLVLKALSEKKVPNLLYPETYLHPSQQSMIPTFLQTFQGPDQKKDQA